MIWGASQRRADRDRSIARLPPRPPSRRRGKHPRRCSPTALAAGPSAGWLAEKLAGVAGASFGAVGLHPLLHQLLRAPRSEASQRLKSLAAGMVVRSEEMFDLVEQTIGDVLERAQVVVVVRVRRDGDQAVVALALAVALGLLGLDDADQPRRHNAPDKRRFVHQDEHVQRVAVLTAGGGDVPEIEREDRPGRQYAAQREEAGLLVELILIAAPLRRLDDDVQVLAFGVARGQAREGVGWHTRGDLPSGNRDVTPAEHNECGSGGERANPGGGT